MATKPNDCGQDCSTWTSFEIGAVLARVQGIDSEGKGEATVNLAYEKGKKAVVVKRFYVDEASDEAIKLVTHEISMMKNIRHENILPCLASIVHPHSMEIWLVMISFSTLWNTKVF